MIETFVMKELSSLNVNLSNFWNYVLSQHWTTVLWTQLYRCEKVFLFRKPNTRGTSCILNDYPTPILSFQWQCQCWKFYSVSALYNVRLYIICFYHSQFTLRRLVTKALKSQMSNPAQTEHVTYSSWFS